MKITKTLIDGTPCPVKGQTILRDSTLPGFGIRLTPTCKSYVVESVIKGVRKRVTLGRCSTINVEEARKEAQRILNDMASGIEPVVSKAPTLNEVMSKYFQERTLMKDKTKRSYRSLIERSMPDWLELPVTAITKEMVLTRHKDLIRPTRCGTDNKACANSALQILRSLMNFAGDYYPQAISNPTDAMKYRWYRKTIREGTIPDSDLARFFRVIMADECKIARDFVLLLLFTGLRRSEAKCLRWQDIDFDKKIMTIDAEFTKSKRTHVLPLTPIMIAILQSRLPAESEFIFPGRHEGHINEPRAVLARWRAAMGWHWLLHDLRRGLLSQAEKIGVPFLVIQKIANHVMKREVTDQYLIIDVEYVRPHLERINERQLELMQTTIEEWQQLDGQEMQIASVVIEEFKEEEVYF